VPDAASRMRADAVPAAPSLASLWAFWVVLATALVAAVVWILGGGIGSGPDREYATGQGLQGQVAENGVRIVRPKFQATRGMEYVLAATLAVPQKAEIMLLEDLESRPPVTRGERLAQQLLAALEAGGPQGPEERSRYASITAVVAEEDFLRLVLSLRAEGGGELYERRFPYLLFSGRAVARFEREATGQELLVISAFDYRRPSPDVLDVAFQGLMANRHPPDLVALDLDRQAWFALARDYARASGEELWQRLPVRGPVGGDGATGPAGAAGPADLASPAGPSELAGP